MAKPAITRRHRPVGLFLVGLIAVVLVAASARVMSAVLIPVILAVFLTLMVLPMERAIAVRLPDRLRWLGRAGVMVILLGLILAFVGALAFCVQQIAATLPEVSKNIGSMLPQLPVAGDDGPFARVWSQLRDAIQGQSGSLLSTIAGYATGIAQSVVNAMGLVLVNTALVLFLVLLALSEAGRWQGKLDTIFAKIDPGWRIVTTTLGRTLRRFIVTRTIIGILSATIYAVWLWVFDLDLILIWAILTFLLTFIPNIGSLLSSLFPVIYAFLTLDPGSATLIAFGLLVIEQVVGNYLDPRLQGDQIALSPLVILISVVFWGWLWGVVGAFLGTPMTLAIMILCNRVDALRPIALLLSNKSQPAALDDALGWK